MLRKRHDGLEDVNLLEIVPVRTADWEERSEQVIVLRPTPTSRGIKRTLDWFLYFMAARKIRLDEIGSFIWHQIDGTRSVAEIAQLLEERFGDRVQPAEERLGFMVRVFRREELVGYRGFDETANHPVAARCVSD